VTSAVFRALCTSPIEGRIQFCGNFHLENSWGVWCRIQCRRIAEILLKFWRIFGLQECIIPGGCACACGSVDTEEAVTAAGGGGGGGEWRSVKICELLQLFCE
jgi:hypothetical protein